MSDADFTMPTPAQEAEWAAEELQGMEALRAAAEAAEEADRRAHAALEALLWERCPELMLDSRIWAGEP